MGTPGRASKSSRSCFVDYAEKLQIPDKFGERKRRRLVPGLRETQEGH